MTSLAAPPTAARMLSGELQGAPWRLDVPADWNGDLVMLAHGYEPVGVPRTTPMAANDSTAALLDGEPISPLARAATLFDLSNGMAVRADPKEVAFPNLDLTAHLFGMPEGEWLGFDTSVSFGHQGLGLTSTVLHDARGPIGMLGQALTVRP